MKKEKQKGRKAIEDSTRSCTVSLRPSEKQKLIKKYQTLTKAIKTLINEPQ